MNRRAPLILVADPAQISSGVQPDRHQFHMPLWESALNARFYAGKVRRLFPAAQMFTAGFAGLGRGLSQHQDGVGTRWVWTAVINAAGTDLRVHRWYGLAAQQITSLAGGLPVRDQTATKPATMVDFLHWGNWTLINAGVTNILRWRPEANANAGALDVLPNAPTGVVSLQKKANQLLAVGHGLNQKQVSWCHADDLTRWTAGTDSSAGTLTIEELETGIRAAARLGSNIACYSEDQLALVNFLGFPFWYGQRVVLDGVGAVGKHAVVSDGRLNYGMSRNGCWRTDGNEVQWIDQGAIADYFQENVNWDQASKIVVSRNDVNRTIEFYMPFGSSLENNQGWAFDPATGGWGYIPPFHMAMERKLFDKPLALNGDSVLLLDDNPGALAVLTLKTKPMLAMVGEHALHQASKIDEIQLMVKKAVGVEFRYGVSENTEGVWLYSAWQPVITNMHTYQLGPELPTGTWHVLEFRSVLQNWDFDLQGFALFGDVDGQTRDAT